MTNTEETRPFRPGDIYEDCAFHPVLCVSVDYDEDSIRGISLIDGSHPHDCSLVHCGIRRLTPEEAWAIRLRGPSSEADRESIDADRRWWTD